MNTFGGLSPQAPAPGDDRWAQWVLAAKTVGLSRLLQFWFDRPAQDDAPAADPGPWSGAVVYAQDGAGLPGPDAPVWN